MPDSSNNPLNFLYKTNLDVTNRMGNYDIVNGTKDLESLFKNAKITPFPVGNPDPNTGSAQAGTLNIHNDEIYDTSITSILDFTSNFISMRLDAAHFAYLKKLGVYPNNRLLIARRFPAPVGNDLTAVTSPAISTLISWVDNDSDFMDISFGEEWISAKASFEEILNGIGKDTTLSADNSKGMAQLGTNLSGGAGLIPLPGLVEGLQRKLIEQLEIADPNSSDIILPIGDPNLIREAMQRRTFGKGEAGSGLKCDFKIKMKVEFEQKYINGIDPTIAYLDLISNVLSFATSDARFMYNESFATGNKNLLGNLMSGDIGAIQKTIEDIIDKFISTIGDYASKVKDAITNDTGESKGEDKSIKDNLSELLKLTLGAVIGKYKMAILGVISSLTGVPSTPWHVTIGNPRRPLFSSGDLWMDNVRMTMGPMLSFNDLPNDITVEFDLKPARSLGAQEIFNRFNTGRARSYVRVPDMASSNTDQKVIEQDDTIREENGKFSPSKVSDKNNTKYNSGGNYLDGNGRDVPFA